jgi:hypothetical protein
VRKDDAIQVVDVLKVLGVREETGHPVLRAAKGWGLLTSMNSGAGQSAGMRFQNASRSLVFRQVMQPLRETVRPDESSVAQEAGDSGARRESM